MSEVIGRTDFDIFDRDHAAEALRDEQQIIQTGEPVVAKMERETFVDRPDCWVSTTKLPLIDAAGQIIGTYGISRDVTEQVKAQEALAYQALHDPVTGLPNRAALTDRLAQALLALERRPGRVALLFIDLDDFKAINDARGHDSGDRVLAEVGRRLGRVARRSDTIARLGGDEFVMLCTDLHPSDDLRLLSDRLLHALRTPIDDGQNLVVTASLGAVATSDPSADPGQLLQRADIAMYAAKRGGGGRFEVYDADRHTLVADTRGLAAELRQALDREELFVVYQPLFRLQDQTLTGVEALVRWRHPQRGILVPSQFIAAAEQHGLIAAIDAFVLDVACGQLAAWTNADASWAQCSMAVNLAGGQLRDPGLVDRVAATLRHHGIKPSRLCLEITETALIDELSDTHRVLDSLSELGVQIALDDFGTGYSTVAHLQRLHADVLKIDRSFVAHLGRGSRDREIIAAITAMAHALGMSVVGEGVETDTERTQLTGVQCDTGQGFLFAKPLPATKVAALWATHQPTPPTL